ncbi:MAG: LPP20 family lipoprotein [Pseudomonadota bacterium]
MPSFLRLSLFAASLGALAGCSPGMLATRALPDDASARTSALAEIKDNLSTMERSFAGPETAPVVEMAPIMGLGLAQISRQPGTSMNEKRLLAIRAARLDALRDLTEQVHGIRLTAETSVRDTIVQNDRLLALVSGEIRGARTERITPKSQDSYEVVLTLDPDVVAYITRAARLGV